MWLIDTGACRDLISEQQVKEFEHQIQDAAYAIKFNTANGHITADKQLPIYIDQLEEETKPYVLPKTPAVLSVGQRCRNQGYSFVWPKYEAPYFILPSGETLTFQVHNNVPYLYPKQEKMHSHDEVRYHVNIVEIRTNLKAICTLYRVKKKEQ